jgi:integrase
LGVGNNPKIEFEKRKQARDAAARVTFQVSAQEWMNHERPNWSVSHATRVKNRLERDLFPAFGKVSIGEIDGPMVLKALRKIEARGSIETAKRVRGYVLEVLQRAKGEKLVKADQIEEVRDIAAALKCAKAGAKQPALLSLAELTQLQQDVDRSLSDAQTKLASRLLALTVMLLDEVCACLGPDRARQCLSLPARVRTGLTDVAAAPFFRAIG